MAFASCFGKQQETSIMYILEKEIILIPSLMKIYSCKIELQKDSEDMEVMVVKNA